MSNPPFRADHVGSLLRPEPLLAAWAEHEKGWITGEVLRQVEDDWIEKAAQMQAELGLHGVTDGEFRRGSWHMDFLYRIGGGAKTHRGVLNEVQKPARTHRFSPPASPAAGELTPHNPTFREDRGLRQTV